MSNFSITLYHRWDTYDMEYNMQHFIITFKINKHGWKIGEWLYDY